PRIVEAFRVFLRRLAEALGHVHRKTDRAALVLERPEDRLADPQVRVSREPDAEPGRERLGRADESEVALLDQLAVRQRAAVELAGDGQDEAQVPLDERTAGADELVTDLVDPLLQRAAAEVHRGVAVPLERTGTEPDEQQGADEPAGVVRARARERAAR